MVFLKQGTLKSSLICLSLMLGLLSFNVEVKANEDCRELFASFLNSSKKNKTSTNIHEFFKYTRDAELLLNDELIQEVLNLNKKVNLSSDDLKLFLSYLDTLAPKKVSIAIKHFSETKLKNPSNSVIKKFNNLKNKIKKKYKKEFSYSKKKIISKNKNLSAEELEKLLAKEQKASYLNYGKLVYACSSTRSTSAHKLASKKFKKFVLGISAATSVAAYSYHNYDKDKDASWFGKIGYEIAIGLTLGTISSKIISNPSYGVIKKGIYKWLTSRGLSVLDMSFYSLLFSAGSSDAQAKLDKILKDPNKKEEIKNLLAGLKDKKSFIKIKNNILQKIAPFAKEIGLNLDPILKGTITDVNWNNLSKKDLKREDVQAVLLSAVLAQAYDKRSGKHIKSGDVGADRFLFHAGYGLIMLPRDVAMSLFIYKILCTGALNPHQALLTAVSVYTVDRILFDQLYFYSRRQSINQ